MACIAVLVDMLRRIYHIHDSHIDICGGGNTCDIIHSVPAAFAVGIM